MSYLTGQTPLQYEKKLSSVRKQNDIVISCGTIPAIPTTDYFHFVWIEHWKRVVYATVV